MFITGSMQLIVRSHLILRNPTEQLSQLTALTPSIYLTVSLNKETQNLVVSHSPALLHQSLPVLVCRRFQLKLVPSHE